MAQESKSSPAKLVQLHQRILKHFDEDELRTLCFDLGVNYDDLPGEARTGKARELVAFLDRRERLAELEARLTELEQASAAPLTPGNLLILFAHKWQYALIGIGVLIVAGIVIVLARLATPAPMPPSSATITATATAAPPTATFTATPLPTHTPPPTLTPSPTPVFSAGTLYHVAIAQFDDRLAPQKVEIAGRLEDDLRTTLESYELDKKVDVKVVPQVLQSETDARALASQIKSDIVIWGLYDSAGIRLRVLLGGPSEAGESKVIRLSELPLGTAGSEAGNLSFYVRDVLPANTKFLSLYVIGHLHYLANNYAEGRKAFDAAAANLPETVKLENEALLHFFNARSIQTTKLITASRIITDARTAVCEYARAIQLDPKMFEAYNNLGVLMTDQEPGWYSQESCVKASGIGSLNPSDLFSQALQIRPAWALAQYNLVAEEWRQTVIGSASFAQDVRPFSAKFQHILDLDPTIPGAYIALGNLSVWYSDFTAAADHFEKALQLGKSAKVAVNWGQALALSGQSEQALAAYRLALTLDPDDVDAHVLAHLAMGNVYHRQSNLARAREEYQLAQQLLASKTVDVSYHSDDLCVAQAKYEIDTGAWVSATLRLASPGCNWLLQSYLRWLIGTIRQEPDVDRYKPVYIMGGPLPEWSAASATQMTMGNLLGQCGLTDVATWGSVANPCLPVNPKARLETVYEQFQTRVHYRLFFARHFSPGIGACPYVFTYDSQQDEWQFDNTIIYKLVGPQAETIQARPLSRFDGRLLIREIEPETSYLDMVLVRLVTADGRELTLYPDDPVLAQDDGHYLVMRQGDERLLQFQIPEDVSAIRQAWVVAAGYYVPDDD